MDAVLMPSDLSIKHGDDKSGLVAQMTSISRTIDSMWRAALHDGRGEEALELGEASVALHRALIALGAERSHASGPDGFAVDWG